MPRKDPNEVKAFAMGFVGHSQHWRQQFVEKWREVLANFVLEPYTGQRDVRVDQPYSKGRWSNSGSRGKNVVLKGGETFKIVMTYASKLVLSSLGDTRGEYVQAEPVGYEDVQKARTVSKLLRHGFSRPGFFRAAVESVVDQLLFGTSVCEIPWTYIEREMLVRNIATDESGFESSNFSRERVIAYDDPELVPIDIQDFYPDPSHHILEKMSGVAKKFRMNAMQARNMVGGEFGYQKQAVENAIKNMGPSSNESERVAYDEMFRENLDQPQDKNAHPDFKDMVGYEYWGEVPWEDDKGSSRRVITILQNVVVRDIPYPLADEDLPFRSFTINPVCGRFYGISPAEVVRYDQDLQDAVNILLAIAIKRQVLPPIAYDDSVGGVDENKIRAWDDDTIIPITGGPNMIGTLKYDSGVFQGFQLAADRKVEMQETSGATAGVAGYPLSSKRMSATEAQNTVQQAMDRPELAAALLERDTLPKIARSFLRRYQQFLDTDGLVERVGQMPEPVWIGDIQGDYDIRFVGSRLAMSRQQKLQSFDRLIAYASAVPQAVAFLPHIEILQQYIGDVLELPDIAAQIGNADNMQLNMILQQLMGQGGAANNGVAAASEPAGALPAQVAGGVA